MSDKPQPDEPKVEPVPPAPPAPAQPQPTAGPKTVPNEHGGVMHIIGPGEIVINANAGTKS